MPADSLRRELLQATGADPESLIPIATDPTGNDLRIAYRGALLRIAARDLGSPEPIEAVADIADELSDLADATLEAALSIARLKLGENALQTRLAVIALGKCGAQELNYVSDVDVLYVAEPRLGDDGDPLISSDRAITVATRLAAEIYGLDILAENIQDAANNYTRFWVVGPQISERPTGNDKTAIVFSIHDRVGTLRNVADVFAQRDISLSSIQSRPAKHTGWSATWD